MNYYAVLTDHGAQLIEQAYQHGQVVTITQMAIGDGSGVELEPATSALAVAGEFDRVPLTSGASASSMLGGGVDYESQAHAGKWIRTLGLMDAQGNLIVYSNYPPTYIADKGSTLFRTLGLNIQLPIVHGDAVTVIVERPPYPEATDSEFGVVKVAHTKPDLLDKESNKAVSVKGLWEWESVQSSKERFRFVTARMAAGEAIKIVAYGDSTVDGFATTDWVANPTQNGNAVGETNHNLTSPNSWPVKLEALLRDMYGNNDICVFNAGYSGKSLATVWANDNYYRAITNNQNYGTPDIVMIDFGLNDVRPIGSQIYVFKRELIKVIEKAQGYGTIPVILTSDPTVRNLDAPNAILNREVTRQLDEVKRDVAASFGIYLIEKGNGLRDWASNNADGYRWFVEQSTDTDGNGFFGQGDDVGLHFKDHGQSIKAQFIAKSMFVDAIDYKGGLQRLTAGDARVNAFGNFLITLNGYNDSHSVQGFSFKIDYHDIQEAHRPKGPRAAMMTAWVWNEHPECGLVYRGLVGEGWGTDSPNSPVNSPLAPAVVVRSFTTMGENARIPAAVGYRYSGFLKPSDVPYQIGRLPYGLSKIQYQCGDLEHYLRGDKSLFFYGFFELHPIVKHVSYRKVRLISPEEAHLELGNAGAFGLCDTERVQFYVDADLPVGSGVVLGWSHSFGGIGTDEPDGYGSVQASVLYRYSVDTVRVGIVKRSASGKVIFLPRTVAYKVNFADNACKVRVGLSRVFDEIDMGKGYQMVEVSDGWSGGMGQITTIPTLDIPLAFGGEVGGTYSNSALSVGGALIVRELFYEVA